MKRFDLKEVDKEIAFWKEQIEKGWKATIYSEGDNVSEISLTKKTSTGLHGSSYMSCDWTPRALKKLAKGIGSLRK